MEHFDFDTVPDRRGTGSYKWDSADAPDVLPMWVADMDFRTAPCVIKALERRVEQGIFGYTYVPEDYYSAVIDWFDRRHSWKIERSSILYTSGVVPAVSAIIKALASPGDKVIVQTPVYNCFFSSIRNNGCEVLENPLIYDGAGRYSMDFEDLERKASDPRATLLVLCNPHNPAGRVWTRDELLRLGDICLRHGVVVISDEIHCELVYEPLQYTPFATVSPECEANSVSCISPSKAFNTAGLQIANIVSTSAERRAAIDRAININEVCDVNPFGVAGTIAAYREGEPWLKALLAYLSDNYRVVRDFFATELPALTVCPLEATYLVWVDCRPLGVSSEVLEEHLRREAGVWLNAGTHYGAAGEGFMRINIACPRKTLLEGLHRISRGIKTL
ncbi:MAG: pyridoxal phosphate-dependent aminotransferase [Bacteroidales bacterium]|nr:pyridoxal phosphate-dependent aminotransferase [Bacteroidales bacterium]